MDFYPAATEDGASQQVFRVYTRARYLGTHVPKAFRDGTTDSAIGSQAHAGTAKTEDTVEDRSFHSEILRYEAHGVLGVGWRSAAGAQPHGWYSFDTWCERRCGCTYDETVAFFAFLAHAVGYPRVERHDGNTYADHTAVIETVRNEARCGPFLRAHHL